MKLHNIYWKTELYLDKRLQTPDRYLGTVRGTNMNENSIAIQSQLIFVQSWYRHYQFDITLVA